jgi:glycosyltransferase involved in cell wall biosynthesis
MAEYFSPGYKAGGTVRSLENIITALHEYIQFSVITRHHDFADRTPYTEVTPKNWQLYANANCYYLPRTGIWTLFKALRGKSFDVLYVNSLFSIWFSFIPILLWRLGILKADRVIVAPMGELNAPALRRKWLKKKMYLFVCKAILHHKNVAWQGINDKEVEAIKKHYAGKRAQTHTVPDIACMPSPPKQPLEKQHGILNLMFLSRICENKGLHRALNALKNVEFEVNFDIYGPREQGDYWQRIEKIILELPPHIHVEYKGALKPNEVMDTYAKYHAFILPTDFENFGHAIVEGLSVGCIPVISDKTPWKGFNLKRAGYVCLLEDIYLYTEALNELAQMDQAVYNQTHQNLMKYIQGHEDIKQAIQQNKMMFTD